MNPWVRLAVALLVAAAWAVFAPLARPRAGTDRGPRPAGAGGVRRRRRRGRGCPADPAEVHAAATCELLALALASGAGVDEALDAVGEVGPASARPVIRSLAASRRWGLSQEVTARSVGSAWLSLLNALRLADTAGVAPSGPLVAAAADVRAAQAHRLEVATARLRVLVVLPLGLCFLPAFLLTTVVPVVLALAARVATP